MKFCRSEIEGLLIIEPSIFGDDRGYFFESFHQEKLNLATGKNLNFVQDNESFSNKGVLRGLHFQKGEFAQGKLVRVIQGAVLDVAVDIRHDSPTFGQHFSIELTGENKKQLWIPEGFAHGFLTLENNTIFQYKCTNFYAPNYEGSILWKDPEINIQWPKMDYSLSPKDLIAPSFKEFRNV